MNDLTRCGICLRYLSPTDCVDDAENHACPLKTPCTGKSLQPSDAWPDAGDGDDENFGPQPTRPITGETT